MDFTNIPSDIDSLFSTMTEIENSKLFKNETFLNSFHGFLERVTQIENYYNVPKYKIVFIGSPGTGKTTSICNWLGLLKTNKDECKKIDDITLLATSKGRTTIAEVHIRQVEECSSFSIEYMPQEKVENYVWEFCRDYYNCLHPGEQIDTDENNKNGSKVHVEIDRAIYNMSGLIRINNGDSEISVQRRRKALEATSEYANFNEFYEGVLKKIDLQSRNCDNITFDEDLPFEDWVEKTFKDLNDCQRDDCSIPGRIYVNINKKDLDLGFPDYVFEIIDTIGIDTQEAEVRHDLQAYLTDKSSICLIMDKVTSPPSVENRHVLKQTFMTEWDRYNMSETALFVNASDSDLGAVRDANGDPNEGIYIKTGEISKVISAEKLPLYDRNIFFADPCSAYMMRKEVAREYDEDGQPIIDPRTGRQKIKADEVVDNYNKDLAKIFCQTFEFSLEKIYNNLREELEKDAAEISNEVENLVLLEKEYEDKEAVRAEVERIQSKISGRKSMLLKRFQGQTVCKNILERSVRAVHHSTIKKVNSMYGGYYRRWKNDIFSNIEQTGKDLFAEGMKDTMDFLNAIMLNIDENNIYSVIDGYRNGFIAALNESVEKMGKSFIDWALVEFEPRSSDNPFWKKVNALRGDGYKRFVEDAYRSFIEDDCDELSVMLNSEMESSFDNLLQMFGTAALEDMNPLQQLTDDTEEEIEGLEEVEEEEDVIELEEEDELVDIEEEVEEDINTSNTALNHVQEIHQNLFSDKGNNVTELDELIGLDKIKTEVRNLVTLHKIQRLRKQNNLEFVPVSQHLVFYGNPGTGKTTVARILAKLYKDIGILEKGQLVECERDDLVGKYVGHTAPKTMEKIKEAFGGVLFIDEAYNLANKGENDYGQEAIDTLLKAMEDYRDKFIVIVAGYKKQMKDFISSNPGLKSRFSKYIEFPDYSCEELQEIFEMFCRKYQYVLTKEAHQVVNEVIAFIEREKDEEFGNARVIRNLFESVITMQSTRLNAFDFKSLMTIEASDIEAVDIGSIIEGLPTQSSSKPIQPIGFMRD